MSEDKLKWYEEKGPEGDVVISSRIRLARNLECYPFSIRLSSEQAGELFQRASACKELLDQTMETIVGKPIGCYCSSFYALPESEKLALMERHIISPAFISKEQPQASAVIWSEDESVGIMVNEEDHIRIQAIAGGMNMKKAWEYANRIDDVMDEKLTFAYDKQYGYLTSCPTNVGTGMRASYMMFLPALTSAGKIGQLMEEMAGYGITMRGIYGEGTSAQGDIYQISNQRTLGNSEQEIIEHLNHIVYQVIRQERKRRDLMIAQNYDEIEDQVYRSYGVLRYATKLSSADAVTLLGQLKLGVDAGIINLTKDFPFYSMVIAVQRGNIQKKAGKNCGNQGRDKYRAEYIHEVLPEMA